MRSAWVALAILAIASVASAHLVFPDVRGERIIEIHLERDPIQIDYRIGLGMDAAVPVRRAADTNRDFEISAVEGNAALDARTAKLLADLTVCTGRTLDAVSCRHLARTDVERVDAQGWVPGPAGDIHFLWTLDLHASARDIGALRVEDASSQPGVEITEVRITPPAGKPLLVAGVRDAHSVARRFTWIEKSRPPGPRVIVAAWAPPPRRVLWLLLGVVLAGAAILGFRRLRKARA